MILEDRGVEKDVFVKLQDHAVADVVTAIDTVYQTITLLKTHNLGLSFGLPWLLKGLAAAGMGMHDEKTLRSLKDTFLYSLIGYAQNHVLRDMKHGARIPIPDSYLLVGLADEGPAYGQEGVQNVFTLEKGQIFGQYTYVHTAKMLRLIPITACIQEEGQEHPTYLKGEPDRYKTWKRLLTL